MAFQCSDLPHVPFSAVLPIGWDSILMGAVVDDLGSTVHGTSPAEAIRYRDVFNVRLTMTKEQGREKHNRTSNLITMALKLYDPNNSFRRRALEPKKSKYLI